MADNDRRAHHHLRAADSDRDAAAAALGEHYAMGRLTAQEHDERVSAAWRAQTYGDLAALFDDLPPPQWGVVVSDGSPGSYVRQAPTKASRRRRVFSELNASIVPVLPVLIIAGVVAVMIFKGPLPLLFLLAGWWWWSGGSRYRTPSSGRW